MCKVGSSEMISICGLRSIETQHCDLYGIARDIKALQKRFKIILYLYPYLCACMHDIDRYNNE